MSPVEKGRFCSSCQKQVVDFSRMSDREVAMFFKKPSTGSVCGKFMGDQLNREIDIPTKRIPWLKYFFQFLLPGFLLSCAGRTVGKVKVVGEPKAEQVSKSRDISERVGMVMSDLRVDTLRVFADTGFVHRGMVRGNIEVSECEMTNPDSICPGSPKKEIIQADEIENDAPAVTSGYLSGRVVTDKGEGIPFATVTVDNNELIADSSGNYSSMLPVNTSNIIIRASSVGYFSKEMNIDVKGSINKQDIILQANDVMKEVVVPALMIYGMVKKSVTTDKVCYTTGAVISAKKTERQGIQDHPADLSLSKFKLYPNPILRGQEIKIEFLSQQRSSLVIRLIAADGKMTVQKEVKVEAGLQQLAISTDSKWAAGSYFIQLLSNSDKPILQKQIVIQ
jgi:hypothetical protein